MSALRLVPSPPRSALRRALRQAVTRLERPLRILAEEVQGLDGVIDLVAADPGGRVVLVLVGHDGEDLELVANGLAQRAWLRPRLSDWMKLAPELGIRPFEPIDLVLAAPDFSERAVAAARAADPAGIALARVRFATAGEETPRLLLEVLPSALPAASQQPVPPPAIRSVFRTGLRDSDLAVGASA